MSLIPVREHPRVEAGFMVKLIDGSRAVLAKAVDLSLAGLALVDPGEELAFSHVAITLPAERREVVVPVRVTRRHQGQLALQFTDIDWDDMFVLARYLSPRL
jgi:hypothetical protein